MSVECIVLLYILTVSSTHYCTATTAAVDVLSMADKSQGCPVGELAGSKTSRRIIRMNQHNIQHDTKVARGKQSTVLLINFTNT
jgi:hypothetical protein